MTHQHSDSVLRGMVESCNSRGEYEFLNSHSLPSRRAASQEEGRGGYLEFQVLPIRVDSPAAAALRVCNDIRMEVILDLRNYPVDRGVDEDLWPVLGLHRRDP